MVIKVNYSIKNEKDWFKAFPPAGGEDQWQDDFSAKEFAKAVLNEQFVSEIQHNLKLDGHKFSIDKSRTYPERLTRFDEDWHGPRHHDLACIAKIDKKEVALCFEAKVNESLDTKLKNYDKSTEGKQKRIDRLCTIFFNEKYNEKYSDIYYQILTGLAGTVAFAAENKLNDSYFIIYQLFSKKNNNYMETINSHKKAINDFLKYFNTNLDIERNIVENKPINLGKIDLKINNNLTISSNVHIVFMEKEF